MGVIGPEQLSLDFLTGVLQQDIASLPPEYSYLESRDNRIGLVAELRVGRIIQQLPHVVDVRPTRKDSQEDFELKDLVVTLDTREVREVGVQVKGSNRQMSAFNRLVLGRRFGVEAERRQQWLRDRKIIPIVGLWTISEHGLYTPIPREQIAARWEMGLAAIEADVVAKRAGHGVIMLPNVPIVPTPPKAA